MKRGLIPSPYPSAPRPGNGSPPPRQFRRRGEGGGKINTPSPLSPCRRRLHLSIHLRNELSEHQRAGWWRRGGRRGEGGGDGWVTDGTDAGLLCCVAVPLLGRDGEGKVEGEKTSENRTRGFQ